MSDKTHYRKAFNSPYLSSADIVEPIDLKIAYVRLEPDSTQKTKDEFNTAYFSQPEIRPGEKLKPMILNAVNSKTMKELTGSPFIDDWNDITVTIYVDSNVKFGRETVEGLRISPVRPATQKPRLKKNTPEFDRAVAAFKRDKNLDLVKKHMLISPAIEKQIKGAANVS